MPASAAGLAACRLKSPVAGETKSGSPAVPHVDALYISAMRGSVLVLSDRRPADQGPVNGSA